MGDAADVEGDCGRHDAVPSCTSASTWQRGESNVRRRVVGVDWVERHVLVDPEDGVARVRTWENGRKRMTEPSVHRKISAQFAFRAKRTRTSIRWFYLAAIWDVLLHRCFLRLRSLRTSQTPDDMFDFAFRVLHREWKGLQVTT